MPTQAKTSMPFPRITSLIPKLKEREFTMLEERFIRVQSRTKVEILFMVLSELSQENYQFQDLLETLRQNYQSMMEIQRY